MTTTGSRAETSSDPRGADLPTLAEAYFSRLTCTAPVRWNPKTCSALLALIMLWAVSIYGTWATWGNLTIDSGREMYVPAVLAEGKVLYADVWFPHGPAAPYLNSLLFRLAGIGLNALYWAGSLSALGSAILLYLAGCRLGSWPAGFAVGAIVLVQAFQSSAFCFPLPFSFAAVYGCLITCMFLWLIIGGSKSKSSGWVFAAGMTAAAALLLKWEFGLGCYTTLGLLIAARGIQWRSWRIASTDLITVLPGLLVCAWVTIWMVSIGGFEFITQENLQSWPTSFFMKTYGKFWLAKNGLALTPWAFAKAAVRTVIFGGIVQGLLLFASARRPTRKPFFLRVAFFLAAVVLLCSLATGRQALQLVLFPQDMVLYVAIAAIGAWWYFLWRRGSNCDPAVPLLLTLSALVAFRILLNMGWWGYAIYYNGPSLLSFLLLTRPLIPRSDSSRQFVVLKYSFITMACLLFSIYGIRMYERIKDLVPLTTARGTVRVSRHFAEEYAAAINFFREKAAKGESVLSVPEDSSLYFLSGTHCPTRVFVFAPGVVAPGKMTEQLIAEIEQKRVRYLLWSNREFPEYGVNKFGKDFDQKLGDYFTSHYQCAGRLSANPTIPGEWTAYVWERKAESQANDHH